MSGDGGGGRTGDLTPAQAWELLAQDPDAVLVDVRTRAEWTFVGVPDLSAIAKGLVTAEWSTFPDGARNPRFLDELADVPREAPVLFLCRSGVRSIGAADAAAAAGWARSYNVLEGFEGGLDDEGHRGSVGWRARGLPWHQS